MLKRFYSKRSGFTLVEIIVAFAVFAIMASMIVQILNLSVNARVQNTKYQQELNTQEQLLTLIEKNSDNFGGEDGKMTVTLSDGTKVELPFDRQSAMADAEFDSEGLNYFLSNVNYQSNGEGSPAIDGGGSGGSNSGSQASRMDTRITGTGGIENIQISYVIKDTHTYAPGDPNAVPAGHTRYFIMCSASSGSMPETLKAEDVPYSQYRLHFYCCPEDPNNSESVKKALNMAASSVDYTDKDGKVYNKEVYKEATIARVGYLKSITSDIGTTGLKSSNIMTTYDETNNKYTIEQMGTNVVRIGSPFKTGNNVDGGLGQKGVKFQQSKTSKFYVEFVGEDPHLTVNSFGHNATAGVISGSAQYEACPNYLEEYESDGTPEYNYDGTHVNIYGAFLHKRNYK